MTDDPSQDPNSPHPAGSRPATYQAEAASSGGRSVTPQGSPPVYVVQKGSWLGGYINWFGWMLAGICLIAMMGLYQARTDYFDNSGGIQEKYHSLSKTAANKIAVIQATGVIMSGDGFVKKQIDRIRDDDKVKGIVLRVDSPGGTVYGSDFMYHHLVKLREELKVPMVVSMGSTAASGGYYIAMAVGDQEQVIYAEPMTTTGSIGVIIPHYNVSGLMEKLDVEEDSIATHPRKNMLSMTQPMTDDDREVIGKYIGHAFDRFKDIIKSGRPNFKSDPDALDVLATGEVFTAKQALDSGLIDEIGFIEDAIDRTVELAGLDKKKTRVVTYTQPVSLADVLTFAKAREPDMISQLAQVSSAKAWYLSTPVLPTVLGATKD